MLDTTDPVAHSVTLTPLDAAFAARADVTILHALEAAGLDIPNSCRNGTCRTCICRLRAGSVRHLVEWPGLSFDEQRDGYILPCVAVAQQDLVLEAPLARRVGVE